MRQKTKITKKKYRGKNFVRRMGEINYMYNEKFEGNILIVGRTGCGKTTFVQNLGKNKLFRDVKEVYWISKIELSKDRDDNSRDCFTDQIAKFDYPNNVEEFDDLLETYRLKKAEYIENDLGENMVLDKVIVMDDVSGLADRSNEFANFLTVSRKYGVTCVYIFHTIYPTRQNWQMIMSQTKIFNFFPGSVQTSSIQRILSSFASRYSNNYITIQNIWINKLYFDISNSKVKECLTIDTCNVNDLGPGKFRTRADSRKEQI